MAEGQQPNVDPALLQAQIAARQERRDIIAREAEKISKCDGADPTLVRAWVQEVQLARNLPDNAAAVELVSSTAAGAFKVELEAFLGQQADRAGTRWEDIKEHMLKCFVSADQVEYHRRLLSQVKQLPSENILAYNRRFRAAANEAFPGPRNADQNRELVRAYGKGLQETAAARKLVSENWPDTLEAAFNRMTTRETGQERFEHLGRAEEPMEVSATVKPIVSTNNDDKPEWVKHIEAIHTRIARMEAVNAAQAPRTKSAPRAPPSRRKQGEYTPDGRPICFHCKRAGHIARECHQRQCERRQTVPHRRPNPERTYSQRPSGRPGQSPPSQPKN